MIASFTYELNDRVELKKPHVCKVHSRTWQIIRLGADIKIQCEGCGAIVMLSRFDFHKRIKKVLPKETEV